MGNPQAIFISPASMHTKFEMVIIGRHLIQVRQLVTRSIRGVAW